MSGVLLIIHIERLTITLVLRIKDRKGGNEHKPKTGIKEPNAFRKET